MDRLKQLQQLLAESPQDSFLQFAIAKEYEGRDDEAEALKCYRQLLDRDPDYVGAYYHLGKLYERREAYEQAIATYRQGMEIARKAGDQHALSELAGAKLNLED